MKLKFDKHEVAALEGKPLQEQVRGLVDLVYRLAEELEMALNGGGGHV